MALNSEAGAVIGVDYDAELARLNLSSALPLRPLSLGELATTSWGTVLPTSGVSREDLDGLRAFEPLEELDRRVSRILARFESLIFGAEYGCWQLPVYKDTKNRARYGQISNAGSPSGTTLAHRVVWEVYFGEINGGLFLDHLCRNKSCCYPRHLEPVTHVENNRRARAHGRVLNGQGQLIV